MLHTTLPMRPRGYDSIIQYLLSPLSVIMQPVGKKVLCITSVRANDPMSAVKNYVEMIKVKLGNMDIVYTDSSVNFWDYIKRTVKKLPIYCAERNVISCKCGYYQELLNVKRYNRSDMSNQICPFCGQKAIPCNKVVLLLNVNWETKLFEDYEPNWVYPDYVHFISKQPDSYLVSKESEKIGFMFEGQWFGISHQLQWAMLYTYITENQNDFDLTLHYINKVQSKAFFIASIAKIINTSLKINLKALPVVGTNNHISVKEMTINHKDMLTRVLSTKRKEIRI